MLLRLRSRRLDGHDLAILPFKFMNINQPCASSASCWRPRACSSWS